jgi:hypothetical protein
MLLPGVPRYPFSDTLYDPPPPVPPENATRGVTKKIPTERTTVEKRNGLFSKNRLGHVKFDIHNPHKKK